MIGLVFCGITHGKLLAIALRQRTKPLPETYATV